MKLLLILLAPLMLGGCTYTCWNSAAIGIGVGIGAVIGILIVLFDADWRFVLAGAMMVSIALAACAPPAQAAEPPDMQLLLEVICEHETRGVKDRDLTEPGPFGEIGRCQIRISTARELGFDGHWTYLLLPGFNMLWALEKLRACAKRVWRFPDENQTRTYIFGLAFGYNAGCRATISKDHQAWGYAALVSQEYNRRVLARKRQQVANGG